MRNSIVAVAILGAVGIGFLAVSAQADEYPPETLTAILNDCMRAVVEGEPFERADVIESTGLDRIVRSETEIISLMGRPDAVGGDNRLSIGLVASLDNGATLNCDFRYNAFRDTAEADIARVAATQPLIDSWMQQLRADVGQADAAPDSVVLCEAGRATLVTIRGRDETAIAVSIALTDDATLCADT